MSSPTTPFKGYRVDTSLSIINSIQMYGQWFSGDPSTAIRKSRIFGRDDKVQMGPSGGQHAIFFPNTACEARRLPNSAVSSRPREQSERMEGSH